MKLLLYVYDLSKNESLQKEVSKTDKHTLVPPQFELLENVNLEGNDLEFFEGINEGSLFIAKCIEDNTYDTLCRDGRRYPYLPVRLLCKNTLDTDEFSVYVENSQYKFIDRNIPGKILLTWNRNRYHVRNMNFLRGFAWIHWYNNFIFPFGVIENKKIINIKSEELYGKHNLLLNPEGNETLRIVSVNVAYFKNDDGRIFRNLDDSSADLICLQECDQDTFDEKFFHLDLINFHRTDSPRIYIRRGLSVVVEVVPSRKSLDIIRIAGKVIANIHLTGGRHDDKEFRDLVDFKSEELKFIVSEYHPDIIVGDFNAELNESAALYHLSSYPLYKSLNRKDKFTFCQYYFINMSWILNEYNQAFREVEFGPTSIYGGTPDHCLYLDSVQIRNVTRIPFLEIFHKDKPLTDHDGIIFTFSL